MGTFTEKGIISIGTNPGPVHSDRIYKTVYPKAASEFLRVSGFEDLSPSEVETANNEIVGLLGESDETIKAGIKAAAEKLGKPETTLTNLLDKVKRHCRKNSKEYLNNDSRSAIFITRTGCHNSSNTFR